MCERYVGVDGACPLSRMDSPKSSHTLAPGFTHERHATRRQHAKDIGAGSIIHEAADGVHAVRQLLLHTPNIRSLLPALLALIVPDMAI